jgi:hypothetical protein
LFRGDTFGDTVSLKGDDPSHVLCGQRACDDQVGGRRINLGLGNVSVRLQNSAIRQPWFKDSASALE